MKRVLLALGVVFVLAFPVHADNFEIVPIQAPTLTQYPDLPKVQKELRALYERLLALKKQPQFAQAGFGSGFPAGGKWMQDAMAYRDKVEKMNVPTSVQETGSELIDLGMAYMNARRKGLKTLNDLDAHEESVYNDRSKLAEVIWMDVK
jgi:hypothetical protein